MNRGKAFRATLRLTVLFLCCSAAAPGRQMLSASPPLYSGEVSCLHQDRGGYLWIGAGSKGVLRYDGRGLTRMNGAPPERIEQITEDAQGFLWVATMGFLAVSTMPLQAYPPGAQVQLREQVGSRRLPAIGIGVMAADSVGNLWCGTNPMWRLTLATADSLTVEQVSTREPQTVALCARRNGDVWAALVDGSFRIFPAGSSTPTVVGPPAGDTMCAATTVFLETPDHVLYGGRRDGVLWKLSEREDGRTLIPTDTLGTAITALASTPDGSLCIGTESGILCRDTSMGVRGKKVQVEDLLLDREQNLWVAHSRGLEMIPVDAAAFVRVRLDGDEISRILPGPEGGRDFWVGGNRAALCNGDSCVDLAEPELRGARILCTDGRGRLWLFHGMSVFCLAFGETPLPPRAFRSKATQIGSRSATLGEYAVSEEILSAHVLTMSRDTLGEQTLESVWFAGFGVLYCLADDEWFRFGSESGLPTSALAHCVFDGRGRLAVVAIGLGILRSERPISLNGLTVSAGATVGRTVNESVFSLLRPFERERDPAGFLWSDGRYWMGSTESILVFDPDGPSEDKIIPITAASAGGLTCMAEWSHTLWLGTKEGLFSIDADRLAVTRGPSARLLEPEIRSLAVDGTGAILCAHASGATIYRPWLEKKNAAPPVLHLSVVSREKDGMDFDWIGVSLRGAENVRYKTRLAGYDEQWSEPSARSYTHYTNLPAFLFPRTYTFEVLASNGDGVWAATPVRYVFTVAPAWFLSWWFALLLTGLLGLAVFMGIRWKSRTLRRRNIVLRRIVELQKKSAFPDERTPPSE